MPPKPEGLNILGYNISIKKDERSTLSNPDSWLKGYFGHPTKAKVNVTAERALNLSAFLQGVRVISETIAYLPLGLYKESSDNGNLTRQKRHAADRIINRPSNFLTSYKFRETMQAIATIRGNAYAYIQRDGKAKPLQLHIINPSYVDSFMSGGDLYYRVYDWADPVHHLDMIHIRGLSVLQTVLNDEKTMGLIGESPLFLGKDSLAVGIAAQDTEGAILGNSGMVNGYLKMDGKIDPTHRQAVEDSWQTRYGGDNKGKTPLLGGGMEYVRVAMTPQEYMLMDTRKFSVEEVARLLNIPQHKLGHLDKASFNNIEQLARDFYIQTVRPWTENWESELELKLLTEAEKEKMDTKFRFDFMDLLRADTKVLGEFIRLLSNVGIISINDGRRMLQMNVVEEDWADKHWVPLNVSEPDNRPEPKAQGQTANTDNINSNSDEK